MSSSPKTLDAPKKGKPEKLDRLKKGVRSGRMVIDLDMLPEDLAAAFIESQKPYRHDAAARKRISESRLKGIAKRKAEWMARREAAAVRKPWRTDSGRAARILELAREWVTAYELRLALNVYRGAVRIVLDRLWREGRLLKRKNPAWCGKPGWGVGIERCQFQYKAASVDVSEKPKSEDDGRKQGVKEGG